MPSLDDFTTMSTQSLPGNDEQEKANIPTMPLPSEEQRKLASQHPDEKDEEQRRRAILADFPLPIAPIGSGQPAAGNVPMVQGTPQFNGVPTVQGTPSAPSGLPDASYLASSAPPAPSLIAPPPAPHLRSSATKAAHGSAAKVVIITVTTIVVLSAVGVGIAAYLLTRLQPVISVSSDYKVGSIPVGSIGTVLLVSGHTFSDTSVITFLLDGVPVGNKGVSSDAKGNIKAILTITNRWAVGRHTLTAEDASGYATKNGVTVMIVAQGQANTPGPNGAPPNKSSFKLNIKIQGQDVVTGQQFTDQETLVITGHPDPAGGTVCQPADDGKPHTFAGTYYTFNGVPYPAGIPYRETFTSKCSGTYKGGRLSYAQTVISDTVVWYYNGLAITCVANAPYVNQQLDGTFSSHNTMSGTFSSDSATYTCNRQGYRLSGGDHYDGDWTGQLVAA